MRRDPRSQARYERHARIIRRNERRRVRHKRFWELRAAQRAQPGETGVRAPTRFELAPQVKIDELWPQVKFLLKAFGHPEALVTDESLVWDMVRDGRKLIAIRRKLRASMTSNDYIFAVAQRLLEKQRKREASYRKR